jgi:hypothetical protein
VSSIATPRELIFVALLVALVLLAQWAPRIGERIGGMFEKKSE